MLKAYKYRIYPTLEQQQTLSEWFGSCRFVYNLGLEAKVAAWTSLKKNVTCFDLMKQLTELKHTECQWLKNVCAQSLESSITNLDKAYTKFFKGGGFPKFKKKTGRQSIQFRQGSSVLNNKLYLQKFGFVDIVIHREFNGEIRTVTVSRTVTGKYYASILVKDDSKIPDKKPISDISSVGIDLGITNFATLSDGKVFENPKYLQKQLGRLKKEQRTLDRRYKKGVPVVEQSKGWHKQKLVVALLHEKIKNQRQDFLHKTSSAIIKQYDTICLEDLNISGMVKNHRLSKSISDASWHQFNSQLEYKADWNGKNIKKIGRFDPSSKICSNCGTINKELKLGHREWECKKCGIFHDRDKNAAINIKIFGLRAKPSVANNKQ